MIETNKKKLKKTSEPWSPDKILYPGGKFCYFFFLFFQKKKENLKNKDVLNVSKLRPCSFGTFEKKN